MQNITLVSFGRFESLFLEQLAEAVNNEFKYPVKIIETFIDLTKYYDPTRRQYDGNRILKEVVSFNSYNSIKTIGLFEIDLFIPILTYIFGQAYLNGQNGIASTYRLSNERYGLKPDEKILIDRFQKVVIHELGHTFGLKHCIIPTCVMRSGNYVEDLDQKGSSFCNKCKDLIK